MWELGLKRTSRLEAEYSLRLKFTLEMALKNFWGSRGRGMELNCELLSRPRASQFSKFLSLAIEL